MQEKRSNKRNSKFNSGWPPLAVLSACQGRLNDEFKQIIPTEKHGDILQSKLVQFPQSV